jgi:DNA polymerase-3 subunit gamma/tau
MAYTALARKWRPRKFAELVGQEHVRRALVNALETGRVHHAFLFTGTRGVGKTTIARIFAKCLNCETGVTAEPCGVCATCREIDAGRFVDLIEVDAASRTKVDDTRELLDNVQYSPTRGRYKVYLVDEVHMLSTHSFNALLKTLEEPPPHVKFLLATTDPQKLPVTVLSRCLQFNLKRLPIAQIADRMRQILDTEGIAYEPAGEAEARAMLGTIARDHVVRLAELLAAQDVPELMRCAQSLEEFAPDYAQLLDELAGLLVRVAMKQAVPDFDGDELYAPELLERLAKQLSPEDVQLFYQTAIIGRRDLALAPDPRTGFEMTLVRMIAFRPAENAAARTATPVEARAPRSVAARGGPAVSAATSVGAEPPDSRERRKAAATQVQETAPPTASQPSGAWNAILAQLDLQGAARQLAGNCLLLGRHGAVVRLALDPRTKMMRTPSLEDKLAQALSKYFGEPVRLEFETAAAGAATPAAVEERSSLEEIESARRAFEADPGVQGLRERFGATLLPDTVRPVKS